MRLVLFTGALILLGGCQSQSPFTMFGPQTVAAPTGSQSPYYPASGSATNPPAAGGWRSATPSKRISVSADSSPLPSQPSTFDSDSSDRQPIRVVESPQAIIKAN